MKIGVVGGGVIGLAVMRELLRLDIHEVRCFEMARPMGARSAGDARIFRYFHHNVDLVDRARKARRMWDEWSQACDRQLLGSEGLLVSDPLAESRAQVLRAAGVAVEVFDDTDLLASVSSRPDLGPFLFDPSAGVIDAAGTGAYLRWCAERYITRSYVKRVDLDDAGNPVIWTESEMWHCDAVLITAGAGTSALAWALDIVKPSELHHHVRLTFRLRNPHARPPCWFDDRLAWRSDFDTYCQSVRRGYYSIGAHLPAAQTQWALGADAVAKTTRRIVGTYVEEVLDGLDPMPVEEVRCDFNTDSDGYFASRKGPVLVFWGETLFKFAPLLGRELASALLTESAPDTPT